MKTPRLLLALLLFCISQMGQTAPINIVPNWGPSPDITPYFLTELTPPGTQLVEDGILDGTGISFAESFAGQAVTIAIAADAFNTTYDVLSGTPGGPLALAPGLPGRNVVVRNIDSGVLAGIGLLQGLGPTGNYPEQASTGTGSVAMLFDADQTGIGFIPYGTGNYTSGPHIGTAWVDFFRRDGTLIDSLMIPNFSDIQYRFAREGGVADIAGLSIYTSDIFGNAYIQLEFNQSAASTVPVPPAFFLFGSGLLGLVGIVKRKKTTYKES